MDPVEWDAVVVGAGPAGCAAAYDLAVQGHRVLLLDRSEFPRSKACAGGLTMKAVRALRYPVTPVVRRWVRSMDLEEGPDSVVQVARRSPACAMTVRSELDAFCLGQTRARGAVFRRVAGLAALEQGPAGVTVRCAGAEPIRARYLLGADGVHSRVRALATGAEWFRTGFALEANVPYAGPHEQYPLCFDFAPVAGGYGWLFPRDNHVNVGLYVGLYAGLHAGPQEGPQINQPPALDRAALERYIGARCGAGRAHSRPVGQFLGLGAAHYRPGANSRVLLAGDAGGFVDPLTGEGIYGAIRSGQAAAQAIHAALAAAGAPGALAGEFEQAARGLQADLQVAEHAAARFYHDPVRGFRLLRLPLMRRAVLHAYTEGLPLRPLLRGVRVAARLLRR